MNIHWTEKEIEFLKSSYKNYNIEDIKKQLPDRTWRSIRDKANSFNIMRKIVYTKNENFFDEPNIINCAVSGFIESDGCITPKNHDYNDRIVITISQKDIDILEQIKSVTEYSGNIRCFNNPTYIKNYRDLSKPNHYFNSDMSTLAFNSAKKWCENLEKHWNITNNKSLTMKAPNLTELDHILAYYSGAICGDGNINLSPLGYLRINLLGTKEFLQFLCDILDELIPSMREKSIVAIERDGSRIYSYTINSFRAYIFSKMVLCFDIPRLNRKWDKAREYVNKIETKDINLINTQFKNQFNLINIKVIELLNKYGQKFPEQWKEFNINNKDIKVENNILDNPPKTL